MRKRICYFDNFTHANSNGYWRSCFEKIGEVKTFDVWQIARNHTWVALPKAIREFNPTHVHCGGSVKHGSIVSVGLIRWIREQFPGVRITYFFGDGYNKMSYYEMLEPYIDNIFMSNSEWCRTDQYIYMPCPAPAENMREWVDEKKYDVVFIGNNYNAERMRSLASVNRKFGLTVFGSGWPSEFNCPGSLPFTQYSDVCSQAKIVLADPAGPICAHSTGGECLVGDPDKIYKPGLCREYECSAYKELRGYLSNRLANTLISGTVHVAPYVEGIEEIFTADELVCYKGGYQERDKVIAELLTDSERRKKIALAGQKKILESLTFDKCARKILFETGELELRLATVEDAKAFSMIRNAEDTFKWFFSGKKFTVREVAKWIKGLNPLTDEVYMVEFEGKLVGTCSIYNIDWEQRSAEIGRIVISGENRGKGLGTRVLNETVRMCATKGLKMIYANIMKNNISSQKAFTKAGFRQASEPTFYWRTP